MSNVASSQNDPRETKAASNHLSTWDGLRRFTDELELQAHLARMEVRDRWQLVEPRLTAFERMLARSSERAGKAIRALFQKLKG